MKEQLCGARDRMKARWKRREEDSEKDRESRQVAVSERDDGKRIKMDRKKQQERYEKTWRERKKWRKFKADQLRRTSSSNYGQWKGFSDF